ncbi:hypothetical protein NDU88_001564 [Pleurodeles waltl]|uniref:Uncharacterized protein n=1 Tax=Pleurodeles waltl TaxID=8319 RepID=A0AAV7M1H5_PLEWA|nr:hypothetical protein NDU88_001564 [Pleurodeles waltl]
MIAHLRAEAMKRGKNWLRAKMAEKDEDDQTPDGTDQTTMFMTEEACGTGTDTELQQRANKRQRAEGKPAKKTAKKSKGPERIATTPAMR